MNSLGLDLVFSSKGFISGSLRRYAPGFLFIQYKLLIIYPPGARSKPTYRGIRPTRESDDFPRPFTEEYGTVGNRRCDSKHDGSYAG